MSFGRSLRRASFAGAGVVSLLVMAPESAHAAPPARKGARITWVRGIDAEGCVGRIGLEEDVKARLGYDPFTAPADLAIEGTVVRASPSGFRAELVVRDAGGTVLGTRQLASREADCRSLGEAVAVAITVAIDPDAPGTRATIVEETPFVAVPEAPPPRPVAPPLVFARERVHAMFVGGASVGLLPDIAPSASLRVRAILGERVELGLGAHFWPESQTSGVGYGITSGSVDACVVPFLAARVLRWCAGVHGGVFDVFVHSPELAPVEVGAFVWAGAETGPALSIPITGAFRLEIGAVAVVPIVRRQAFVRGQSEPLWEQSVVGGRADVGVGATF